MTIFTLWLRQIKRYLRSKSRIIGSLGQPILFLIAFGFGFGPIYQKAGGGDYIQFLTPWIICMSVLFLAMFSWIEIIWDKQFGFLKETLVAPVSRIEIMLWRTLWWATIAVIQWIIVFVIAFIAGFRPVSYELLGLTFIFLAMIAIIFTALGTSIALLLKDMQWFQLIMNFLIMPLFFLSGALFPLDWLPKALSVVASIDPLSYGVDGIRGTLTGVRHFGFLYDFSILFVIMIILLWIWTYLFNKIEG